MDLRHRVGVPLHQAVRAHVFRLPVTADGGRHEVVLLVALAQVVE
eukprot:CAMPEP_0171289348 /NCGR_PEP_ID=MMETSP0790-20130122/70555_1 /TAXON_ID=2925 /ORGANISM="Alexandrium catenella, Strain OF101" /LENGTH=44 /DNA_ID= /DNA_START= /DNA_END= /DNA_ORIENTATION=